MQTNRPKDQNRIRKKDVKRLIGYALKFRKNLFAGVVLLLAAVSFELASPFVIKRIFDDELMKEAINVQKVWRLVLLYVVVNVSGTMLQLLSGIQLRITALRVAQRMRMDLYKNIQRLSIAYFDNVPAGSIVSRIANDTEAVQNLYIKVLAQFSMSAMYIVGIYVALFMANATFAALIFTIAIVMFLFLRYYSKRAQKHNQLIREKLSELNGALNEAVQGIQIIRAFNNQKSTLRSFEKIGDERYREQVKMLTLDSMISYNMVSTLRNIAFMILVYYFGRRMTDSGAVTTVGMIYVYVDYIYNLFMHANRVMEQVGELEKAGAASAQVFALIDEAGKDLSDERMAPIRGAVRFERVGFHYKEGEYVLKDIDLEAKPGEMIALVGHTGSGKSSIMNLLLKFYSPQDGRILIDGMDLNELPDQAIREHMGIVLQEPYLFTGTVLSNITLDKPGISRADAQRALDAVGGEIVLRHLPGGIEERLTERGATLSAGQRQLISFARALAQDPRILILDEATSSIDSETEQVIQRAMQVLMEGRTTFVIAHRLSTIRSADRIYLLDKGRVLEQGNHDELIEKRGRYYEMYQAQSKGQHLRQEN